LKLISLTTDFGNDSPYISVAKAKLLSQVDDIELIDHSHGVEVGDINEAALLIKMLTGHCPSGTIHIIAIDFDQRNRRPEILLGTGFGQYFISYNSGILSLLLSEAQTFKILGKYSGDHNNLIATLAPILGNIGNPEFENSLQNIEPDKLLVKRSLKSVISDGRLTGNVVYVDGRGSLYTNIHKDDVEKFAKNGNFQIVLSRHESLDRIHEHPGQVEPGSTVAYFSDLGSLVIAVHRGNASQLLGIKKAGNMFIEIK